MNYQVIYNNIIKRAQIRNSLHELYTEVHHIIPKCIGGTNCKSNLVNLTPEEHFICHLLLVKIYPANSSLIYAANMMCVNNSSMPRNNNKRYGWLRRKVSESTKSNLAGRKCVHKNGVKKMVYPNELEKYTQDGWTLGIPPRKPETLAKWAAGCKATHKAKIQKYLENPLRCNFCSTALPYDNPWRLNTRKQKVMLNCGTTNCRSAMAKHFAVLRAKPVEVRGCLHCDKETTNPKFCCISCCRAYYIQLNKSKISGTQALPE